MPEVVLDELERQSRELLTSRRDKAKAALSDVASVVDMDEIVAAFDLLIDNVSADRAALLAREGIASAAIPGDITRSLVERDLQRQRPFVETESGRKKSLGFRDAVIWETLLETFDSDDADGVVYFVTTDGGFLDKDSNSLELHDDLKRDLDQRAIEQRRVVVVDSISAVVEPIKTAIAEGEAARAEAEAAAAMAMAEQSFETVVLTEAESTQAHFLQSMQSQAARLRARALEAARHAELDTVAGDALDALIGEEISEQLVYGGDYDFPSFVKFRMPAAMESAAIRAIDLETEFTFRETGIETVTADADLAISIEGATYKGDYFSEDHDELSLIGELNEHYFETAASVPVRAMIAIDVSEGPGRFVSVSVSLVERLDRLEPEP